MKRFMLDGIYNFFRDMLGINKEHLDVVIAVSDTGEATLEIKYWCTELHQWVDVKDLVEHKSPDGDGEPTVETSTPQLKVVSGK